MPSRHQSPKIAHATSATDFLPEDESLESLSAAAGRCRGCELYQYATQTVFGQGPRRARIMLVGEQPGDAEDLAGSPFVGPAGKLLRQALAAAEIDPEEIYMTNAVKHFRFSALSARGKRRIHKRPEAVHINACRPWLEAEVRTLKPDVIVCLGAVAARSVFGRAVSISGERGAFRSSALSDRTLVTLHPSAVLRMPKPADRHAAFENLTSDLKLLHQTNTTRNRKAPRSRQ
jgi:uracil-DNA glycosylase